MVVKEALNNAVKHSGASEVKFSLNYAADKLDVEIADNGRGFRMAAAADTGDGLENMRRRVTAIGGTLEIKSAPGQGTSVRTQVLLSADGMVDL